MGAIYVYQLVLPRIRFAGHHTGRSGHGELNLATVIIIIVTIFVICHLPRSGHDYIYTVRLWTSCHGYMYIILHAGK